jgi:hypothetical protein
MAKKKLKKAKRLSATKTLRTGGGGEEMPKE